MNPTHSYIQKSLFSMHLRAVLLVLAMSAVGRPAWAQVPNSEVDGPMASEETNRVMFEVAPEVSREQILSMLAETPGLWMSWTEEVALETRSAVKPAIVSVGVDELTTSVTEVIQTMRASGMVIEAEPDYTVSLNRGGGGGLLKGSGQAVIQASQVRVYNISRPTLPLAEGDDFGIALPVIYSAADRGLNAVTMTVTLREADGQSAQSKSY
jgi:hypothetical protein